MRELFAGEFGILRLHHPQAYALANLSFDTKFDFRKQVDLPYTDDWFEVPPAAPHGQVPKLGTLHPSMMRAARAAMLAARG